MPVAHSDRNSAPPRPPWRAPPRAPAAGRDPRPGDLTPVTRQAAGHQGSREPGWGCGGALTGEARIAVRGRAPGWARGTSAPGAPASGKEAPSSTLCALRRPSLTQRERGLSGDFARCHPGGRCALRSRWPQPRPDECGAPRQPRSVTGPHLDSPGRDAGPALRPSPGLAWLTLRGRELAPTPLSDLSTVLPFCPRTLPGPSLGKVDREIVGDLGFLPLNDHFL